MDVNSQKPTQQPIGKIRRKLKKIVRDTRHKLTRRLDPAQPLGAALARAYFALLMGRVKARLLRYRLMQGMLSAAL